MIRRPTLFVISIIISTLTCAESVTDFSVKSAFMIKMTSFIDWPKSSHVNDDETEKFNICIEHEQPIKNGLSQWAKTGTLKNKSVNLTYIQNRLPPEGSCDMIFISSKSFRNKFIKRSVNENVLTISDIPGSAKAGVIINFIKVDEKLRFEVNLNKAKEKGFIINTRLLRLAKIVKGEAQ